MEGDPTSLKAEFARAEEHRLQLEQNYNASSESYTDTLDAAIHGYETCLALVSRLALFSPNESVDDLSTTDLPYLLVDYRLAELIQKTSLASPHDRLRTLSHARDAYERFLHLLDSYELLGEKHAGLLAQYTEAPTTFSTTSTADPSARRDSKIANFKAEKELRGKLEFLRRRQSSYADLDGDGTANGGGDEETVRAVYLAELEYCTHMTFQGLEGLNREAEVLLQAPEPLLPSTTSVAEDERRRREEQGDEPDQSGRVEARIPMMRLQSAVGGPLLSKKGKPLQPFTLLGSSGDRTRQEIASGVFRPGHNLPTMTIDEYLAEERRRGGIIEGGGEASGQRPEPDEDDMDKADAEIMRMREWDDFAEANPRGSGNTLNRG